MRVSEGPGWRETRQENRGNRERPDFLVHAVYAQQVRRCPNPKCRVSGQLRIHGYKQTDYRDLSEGRPVTIRVRRKRYRCGNCKKTCLQPLPGMHDRHRMSEQFLESILFQLSRTAFTTIAQQNGIDERTVRRLAEERHPLMGRTRTKYGPMELGIFVAILKGRSRAFLVDLTQLIIVDILPSVQSSVIRKWLTTLPARDRDRIRAVVIDPRAKVFESVREALGELVPILPEKGEFVRMADSAVLGVQRRVHTRSLEAAREARTSFRAIFESEAPRFALAAVDAWTDRLPRGPLRAFAHLAREAREWRTGIANLCDRRLAKAARYVEHVRSELDHIEKRQGKVTFETARQRILWPEGTARSRMIDGSPIVPAPPGFDRCENCRQTFGRSKLRAKYSSKSGFAQWMELRAQNPCWECEFYFRGTTR